MPEITGNGLRFVLPGERYNPYQWGEGDHGEKNPIRNYIAACHDAAAECGIQGESLVSDEVQIPGERYWLNQAAEAANYVELFDDLDDHGRPSGIDSEIYEIHAEAEKERPDLDYTVELKPVRPVSAPEAGDYNTVLQATDEHGNSATLTRYEHEIVDGQPRRLAPENRYYQAGTDTSATIGTSQWKHPATTGRTTFSQAFETFKEHAQDLEGPDKGGRYANLPDQGTLTLSPDGQVAITEADGIGLDHLQGQVGGYIAHVELAGDLDMWVNEEGKLNQSPVSWPATATAQAFGVDHDTYRGDVVFTGGHDAEGATVPLNKNQLVALKEIADTVSDSRLVVKPDLDVFDHRFKHGRESTSVERQKAMEQLHAIQAAGNHTGLTPHPTGPGIS